MTKVAKQPRWPIEQLQATTLWVCLPKAARQENPKPLGIMARRHRQNTPTQSMPSTQTQIKDPLPKLL